MADGRETKTKKRGNRVGIASLVQASSSTFLSSMGLPKGQENENDKEAQGTDKRSPKEGGERGLGEAKAGGGRESYMPVALIGKCTTSFPSSQSFQVG